MGYYTQFELEADRDGDKIVETLQRDASISRFNKTEKGWQSETTWKWYEWEDEVKAVSAQFPLSLITLRGYGEESGDIWQAYFIAGQSEIHKLAIEFPPCSLMKPTVNYATVQVTVLGVDIPVEVEYIGKKRPDELYALAKEQLRNTL